MRESKRYFMIYMMSISCMITDEAMEAVQFLHNYISPFIIAPLLLLLFSFE